MIDLVFQVGLYKGMKKLGVNLPQTPKLFQTMQPVNNIRASNSYVTALKPKGYTSPSMFTDKTKSLGKVTKPPKPPSV